MKIRTDLTGLVLVALLVCAIVALSLAGQPVPEWLQTAAAAALTYAVGAATPTTVGGSTSPAPAPAAEPVGLVADVVPAPATAPAVEAVPAVTPPVPGRDWTEQLPVITPAMVAADKAARS